MNTYNKKDHAEALNNDIAMIKAKLLANVPVTYGGVVISRLNAQQTISDLEHELNNLPN